MDIETIKNFESGYLKAECNRMVLNYQQYLENSDILDIGSNIGLFSLALCKNVKYKSIHLFEPCNQYLSYSKNLLEKYNNLQFNNVGLSNKSHLMSLYKDSSNLGWNTFLKIDPNQPPDFYTKKLSEECHLEKLDDYYRDISNIDFIKMDVEGYEGYALEGSLELIQKFKPYILVEVGWGINHPHWKYNESIYNKIFDIGYERVEFSAGTQDILFKPIP